MDKEKLRDDAPAYTQRLRPETLDQMLKSRRVMPHEVEPLIKELMELRALHSVNEDRPVTMCDRIDQIADLLHMTFSWSDTPQGGDFWEDVHSQLRHLARHYDP
jgi:hypothetical protein